MQIKPTSLSQSSKTGRNNRIYTWIILTTLNSKTHSTKGVINKGYNKEVLLFIIGFHQFFIYLKFIGTMG